MLRMRRRAAGQLRVDVHETQVRRFLSPRLRVFIDWVADRHRGSAPTSFGR